MNWRLFISAWRKRNAVMLDAVGCPSWLIAIRCPKRGLMLQGLSEKIANKRNDRMSNDTTLTEVDISDNVYLQYDEEDTWIAIADKQNWYYDEIGTVVISVKDAKLLLSKLKELIEKIEAYEKL